MESVEWRFYVVTVLQISRLCCILGCVALLCLSVFQMNGIYLVSSGFSHLKKRQRVRRIIGEVIYL